MHARAAGLPDTAAADHLLDLVPVLRGRPRKLTQLSGGSLNRTYRVSVDGGEQYAARFLAAKSTLLWIDRDAELANASRAAEAGVGPRVVDYLLEDGLFLFEWIDGTPLAAGDLTEPACLERIAELSRQLHSGQRFASDFDLGTTRRRYLAIAHEHGYRIPDGFMDLEPVVSRVEEVLLRTAPPSVPCHNDLFADNIIDDGKRLWLIDYEYSANADPCYEFGNLSSEARLAPELVAHLVEAYLGYRSPAMVARVRLYGVLCDYTWTLWGVIQDATADADTDFGGWALQRYARARTALTSSELEDLLAGCVP